MRAEYDFSKAKRGALLPSKGKTRITIYIDDVVLEKFRSRAERAGSGYQTMINDALRAYLAETDEHPLTESVLRRVIREEVLGLSRLEHDYDEQPCGSSSTFGVKETMTRTNYWVVGAMWNGQDDQSEKFIREGYWYLGWSDEDKPDQAKLRDQMKPGDRIAIKRMLGRGSPSICIRALGVIEEVDEDDKRVYVNWLLKGLEREVPSKGAYRAIQGPYVENDPWIKEVFHI